MKDLSRVIIIFLLLPFTAQAVIINELAWMGTTTSYNDEWIELYNDSDNDINLTNWTLKTEDGSLEINLEGIIPTKGFYLLERTDDETIINIPADLIYTGSLGNNGENIKLYNDNNILIDEIICLDSWPAGDNATKQTMQKINNEWQTADSTPKALNIAKKDEPVPSYIEEPVVEETLIIAEEPTQLLIQSYPKNIAFIEILPSPEGPDDENEYIKIFNNNDFEVDLSNWIIKDGSGKITEYTLKTTIPALSNLIFRRPETKITLNNEGDKLILLDPNKNIIDSVEFGKATQGESYIKNNSEWIWTTSEIKQNSSQKNLSQQNSKDIISDQKANLIKIVSLKGTESSPIPSAVLTALLSAVGFLIIKNNLKTFWY
jgi:hypothetical protein